MTTATEQLELVFNLPACAHDVVLVDECDQCIAAVQPKHAAPTHPMPGDAVRLDGVYRGGVKTGAVGIIDSVHYGQNDEVLVVFNTYGAFRGPLHGIGALAEFAASGTRTAAKYRLPIGRDHVSCSGGPAPYVSIAALTFVGMHVGHFWKWRNGIAGAGRGENFSLEVPLWSWAGPKDSD